MPTYTRTVPAATTPATPQETIATAYASDFLITPLLTPPVTTRNPDKYIDGTVKSTVGSTFPYMGTTTTAHGAVISWSGVLNPSPGVFQRTATITVPSGVLYVEGSIVADGRSSTANVSMGNLYLTNLVRDGEDYLLTLRYDIGATLGGVDFSIVWNGIPLPTSKTGPLTDVGGTYYTSTVRLARRTAHNSEITATATSGDGWTSPTLHIQWISPYVVMTFTPQGNNVYVADASSAWSPTGYIAHARWNYTGTPFDVATDPDRSPLVQTFDYNPQRTDTSVSGAANVTAYDEREATASDGKSGPIDRIPNTAAAIAEPTPLGRVFIATPGTNDESVTVQTLQRVTNGGPLEVRQNYDLSAEQGRVRRPMLLRTPNGLVKLSAYFLGFVGIPGSAGYINRKSYNGLNWSGMTSAEWTEPFTEAIYSRDVVSSQIPNVHYAAAQISATKQVVVKKTVNNGATWQALTNPAFTTLTALAYVSIGMASPSEVFVTCGTAGVGGGFRSTRNEGETWE